MFQESGSAGPDFPGSSVPDNLTRMDAAPLLHTHPATVIQARHQELVSSNGRSNTTLGQCGASCPKNQQDVCVRYHDEANTIHLYYLTTSSHSVM